MTDKTKPVLDTAPDIDVGDFCKVPERPANHFCAAKDQGIVVDMEIQAGDPVDSQIIRNFIGEFEAASKKSA